MKQLILIIFGLSLISGLNAQSQFCFNAIYTDREGSFSKNLTNPCGGSDWLYLVKPTGTFNSIKIHFSQIYIESAYDAIGILGYDPDKDELIEPWYWFDISNEGDHDKTFYIVGKAFIFVFDHNETDLTTSYTFNYEVLEDDYVSHSYNYTLSTGTFDDGSGSANYEDNIINRYVIKPTDANSVEMVFTNCNLASGENLKIYDGENENAPLLKNFEWNEIPSNKFISSVNDQSPLGNSLCILFTTDSQNNAPGWDVEYRGLTNNSNTLGFHYDSGDLKQRTIEFATATTKSAGISKNNRPTTFSKQKYVDNIGRTSINIYPNPTHGELRIDVSGFDLTQKSCIYVFNPLGKIVKQVAPITLTNIVNLNNYSSGTYILRIVIGDKTSEWKILKE